MPSISAKLKRLLEPDVSHGAKLIALGRSIGATLDEVFERLLSLEARQLQKGDKGDKGDKGEDGKNGKDGKNGLDGKNGKDGKDGKDGKTGKQGVSVVDSWVAADNHLVFKLSNGNEIDVGEISTEGGQSNGVFVSGNAYQITVSSTAPTNPQTNDLWLQV